MRSVFLSFSIYIFFIQSGSNKESVPSFKKYKAFRVSKEESFVPFSFIFLNTDEKYFC